MKGLKGVLAVASMLVFVSSVHGIVGFGLEPEVDFVSQSLQVIASNPDKDVDAEIDMGKSACPAFRLRTKVMWARLVLDFIPSNFQRTTTLERDLKLPNMTFHAGEEVKVSFVRKVAGGALRAHLPIPFVTVEPGIGFDLWINPKIEAEAGIERDEYQLAEFILVPALAFKVGVKPPMVPLGVFVEGKWIKAKIDDAKPSYISYWAGLKGDLPVSIPFLARLHYLGGYKFDSLKYEKENESYELKSKGFFVGLSLSLL